MNSLGTNNDVFGKMAVKVDEEWLRDRVHLKHDNLDDVKSLSLPGSYHEKISYLGTSLQGFTRLKHLDLSRNTICNLEGIGHLQMLETLNLYYNNISTLKDLYQLRTLVNLKELDIRLNPVTKNEPDHRLFLVHMLPNLKKLDDRSVRDSERKAALMHFSTDQASEFTDDLLQELNQQSNNKLKVPRAELVKSLGQRTALDNDDVMLLDMMVQKDSDFLRPSYITGSSNKFPDVQDYPQQELWNMHDTADESRPDLRQGLRTTSDPHIPLARPSNDSGHFPLNAKPVQIQNDTSTSKPKPVVDSSYAPYIAQSNFTPTPFKSLTNYQAAEQDYDDTYQGSRKSNSYSGSTDTVDRDLRPALHLEEEQSQKDDGENITKFGHSRRKSTMYGKEETDNSCETSFLYKLVELVDKYWNGSKSLHGHSKFKEIATDLLKSYQSSCDQGNPDTAAVTQLQQELSVKEDELQRLSEHFAKLQEECTTVQNALEKEKVQQKQSDVTNEELTTLHTRFKKVQEENKSVKAALESQKGSVLERKTKADEVMKDYHALQQENQTLKQQLDCRSSNLQQLNELTNMLQESHRSLVATNDHLLLELAQEKDRHQSEVNQLHWSYKQLKKSIDWIPSADKGHLKI